MKKLMLPLSFLMLITACSDEHPEPPPVASETEVTAPEGEFDPTDSSETDEAVPVAMADLVNGTIEEGTAVSLPGTVEELTDDGAFPAFILTDGEHQIFVRNMADTSVQVGSTITIAGVYDGTVEEDMPLVSATIIQ